MAESNFASPRHAFQTGQLFGLLLKSGIEVTAETDDHYDYTDVLQVIDDDGTVYRLKVLP